MRILLFLSVYGLLSIARAQVNNWINPASARWDSPTNWSLGALPASSQSVNILNAGYKAVDIDSATISGFPSSLTIGSLTVSAPTTGLSTLLLNYFGQSAPLKVLNSCLIQTNGTILNLSSSFEVDGGASDRLTIDGGTFTQQAGLTVIKPTIEFQNGTINATNATMNLGTLNMGFPLTGTSGNFYQSGGTVLSAGLRIDLGTYTLLDSGTLYALDSTILYSSSSHFEHASGTNYGNVRVSAGSYHLHDGLVHGNDLFTTGSDGFVQYGGTAEFATIEIQGPGGGAGYASYNLQSGTLHCGELSFTANGIFQQSAGATTLTNGLYLDNGVFSLFGGTVSMPSLVVTNRGAYQHYGGTNQVAGDVQLYDTGFLLEGGRLSSVNLSVGAGAELGQYGGTNDISGVLSITGTYSLGDAVLSVNGMWLRGSLYILSLDPPSVFINTGMINFGGTLYVSVSQNSMGQLGLSTNGTIILADSSAIVRFADSSALNWEPNSRLTIVGWRGSYSGNGSNQVYFGTTSGGLTLSMLSQVEFLNPAGIPPGTYNARILSTGEIVPDNSGAPPPWLVNNWTNPVSARWDSPANWSLATLPASNQTVYITNAGYKAVNIDYATITGSSNSLTVSNLSVSAPSNALSTLLLNYAGLGVPLKVQNGCVIGTNGTIDNFSSSFELGVNGGGRLLLDGGTFTQVGGQTVVNGVVLVNSGSLNATNGNMTLGGVSLGNDTSSTGTFNQAGGSIAVTSLSVRQGNYNLYDGILYALQTTSVYPGPAFFNQYGGTNFGDVGAIGDYPSIYRLLGGFLRGTNIAAVYSGMFCQGGGEAQAALVNLSGPSYQTTPNYVLTNGVLRIGTLSIHSSSFLQMNGQVIITNPLSLYGYDMALSDSSVLVYPVNYTMQAGTLSSPAITVMQYVDYVNNPYASFTQGGGTNIVAGDLSLVGANYSLAGDGLLQTSNSVITNGSAAPGLGIPTGLFQQQSGTHNVTGTLSIYPGNTYQINGGSLSVGSMSMHGVLAIGNINGSPTASCSGLFDLGGLPVLPGLVQVQVGTHHLGSLRLTGDARLNFGNRSATLNFDSSSSISWSNGVSLVISNWSNSGGTHIFFGNNASALTGSQLAQITFSNPGGFSAGNYAAKLLSTGELVPVQSPTLQSARYGAALVLTWPNGYQLLSATDVIGPYAPVPSASSPWTNSLAKPREFFRLQGL
jgi:hypothetical protein